VSSFLEKNPATLDLGEEEAKVYAFLNREGEASAMVIADKCFIPFSRIHKVLYRLQQQELIVSRGDVPKLYSLRFKDPQMSSRHE